MILTAAARGVEELARERSSPDESSRIPQGSKRRRGSQAELDASGSTNSNEHTMIISWDRHGPLLSSTALKQGGHCVLGGGRRGEIGWGRRGYEEERCGGSKRERMTMGKKWVPGSVRVTRGGAPSFRFPTVYPKFHLHTCPRGVVGSAYLQLRKSRVCTPSLYLNLSAQNTKGKSKDTHTRA